MNFVDYLFSEADQNRGENRVAFRTLSRQIGYEELSAQVRRMTGFLSQRGITNGKRVALLATDSPEWIVAVLGILGAGAIAVPLGTMLKDAEIISILRDSRPVAIVVSEELLEVWQRIAGNLPDILIALVIGRATEPAIDLRLALEQSSERAPVELKHNSPAFILYTSGSTGRSKGAVHAHGDFCYTVDAFSREVLGVTSRDRIYSSSKLYFAYGLGNSMVFPLASGATSMLLDERPKPELIARIFTEQQPTIFCGVPAVFRGLLEYARAGGELDVSSLRVCVSAGEALPAGLYHQWKQATGVEIIDAIGSTEMLHMFISNRIGSVVPGSSGLPLRGCEARLTAHDGGVIEGAGSGNLWVRSPSQMRGYWMNEEKTRETIVDEWVRTGDVYRRDENGVYFFEGRSDDLFKVKGLWISPPEVEEALLSHPEVREAAVVEGHDADGLPQVVAFVVFAHQDPSADGGEKIRAHVRGLLPGYKCPAVIRFISELPRTPTGKVQRFKLRA